MSMKKNGEVTGVVENDPNGYAVIFKREEKLSSNYYYEIKLHGHKPIARSCKTDQKSKAFNIANREYYEILNRLENEQNLVIPTTEKLVDLFDEHLKSRVVEKQLSDQNYKAKYYRLLYIRKFFGKTALDKLRTVDIEKFINYLHTSHKEIGYEDKSGKRYTTIRYVNKKGKKVTSKRPIRPLSPTTIKFILGTLDQLFDYAIRNSYVNKRDVPEFDYKSEIIARVPFTRKEIEVIEKHLDTWIANSRDRNTSISREVFAAYVMLLRYSGIRVGEARYLKWRHYQPKLDKENYLLEVALHIPKSKVKKAKGRTVSIHPDVHKYMAKLQKVHARILGREPHEDDYLWISWRKKHVYSYKQQFKKYLEFIDVTHSEEIENEDPIPYTIYCLRHSYATHLIEDGGDSYFIAKNMGTSQRMLIEHYDKSEAVRHGEKIHGSNAETQKAKKKQDNIDNNVIAPLPSFSDMKIKDVEGELFFVSEEKRLLIE
ncbi:hypothetical protein MTBPR1_100051 [Candidatus Terasakiella magnetica]|uniref:Tyr recombinase domain-containing protein n=1 Tax=Candidatus Terasakiella magnetica TaxID=1867952 RepID=A0A1C3RDP0_9PROT|nr:site-specific integrase [Candidatus Terasakiella magnetica]SCA55410.1 hypothetical protein MTBPR1_100051 [Candidatus Terasakiella magnetica]